MIPPEEKDRRNQTKKRYPGKVKRGKQTLINLISQLEQAFILVALFAASNALCARLESNTLFLGALLVY